MMVGAHANRNGHPADYNNTDTTIYTILGTTIYTTLLIILPPLPPHPCEKSQIETHEEGKSRDWIADIAAM